MRTERGSGRDYLEQVALTFENQRYLLGLGSERMEQPSLCIKWFGPSWEIMLRRERILISRRAGRGRLPPRK